MLNVIAEPPLASGSFGSADAFRDVSAVAAGLVRHAREREQAVQEAVGAVLASNASQLSLFNVIQPVALLAAQPASVSASTPELHIQPPVQSDEDVLVELDGVMQAEQAKRKIADEIFAGDKQRNRTRDPNTTKHTTETMSTGAGLIVAQPENSRKPASDYNPP